MFHKPQCAPPSTPEVGEDSIDAVSETGGRLAAGRVEEVVVVGGDRV